MALLLREGDKNTKFFHRMANSNEKNNIVDSLVVKGFISSDSTKIREHIVQFYNQLSSEQFNWQPKFDGLSFKSICAEKATQLERAFGRMVFLRS